MSTTDEKGLNDVKFDANNIYLEESFTDLKMGIIQRLTPVKPDGSVDESRSPIFTGQTHVMTAAGPLPVQCPLEANNFEEAMENFPAAIKKAVERMVEQLKQLQRKEDSKIIIPGEEGPGKIKLK